ncbi:MAG: hypothetical protein RLZZ383_2864 [Pseudomonadota bacterium]
MLPPALAPLAHLARNLWGSWTPEAVALWRDADALRWDRHRQNPLAMLQDVEPSRWAELAADAAYVARVHAVSAAFERYLAEGGWQATRGVPPTPVAYFSMEFGLHTSLRIYSGGLGVLAGDHLKSASDLGIPLTAVGLFYHQGYFRQVVDDGVQVAAYVPARLDRLPLEPVLDAAGQRVSVRVPIGEHDAVAIAWRVPVGRISLYLLDVDHSANPEPVRQLTRTLYGGDEAMRIGQEALLGIGGVGLLRSLGVAADVYHMNEGHCAFVPVALMREATEAGASLADAVRTTRRRCVFTTHTPVPAGHDRFPAALVTRTLGRYEADAGWAAGTITDLGRVQPGNPSETLCMTVLALRTAHATNGVAAKHGEVSRQMWHGLWPDRAVADVPIGHITNGVHPFGWMSDRAQALFDRHVAGWRAEPWREDLWAAGLETLDDATLWATRNALRGDLCAFLAQRQGLHLDPHALTIGFARRFATYKRGDLLFRDPDRLAAILSGPLPVQIVYSGKAHPRDAAGQAVLANVLRWSEDPRFRGRVFFVEDYDMEVGAALTSGVDVWLNNPRRPQEASGTSGQKVTLNLGLNLSVLDGWWIEGFDGTNGWAIGPDDVAHDQQMDEDDAEALYAALESAVVPAWRARGADGVPTSWLAAVRRSTITCASRFNSHRMVKDYVERLYAPSDDDVVVAAP